MPVTPGLQPREGMSEYTFNIQILNIQIQVQKSCKMHFLPNGNGSTAVLPPHHARANTADWLEAP